MKPQTTILAAILGLTVLVSTPVSAESSCVRLHTYWTEYKKDENDTTKSWYAHGFYGGYITGWADSDTLLKFPKGASYLQYAHVVGKWLENNPEKWHLSWGSCTFLAFKEAYDWKD
jgi:hypothetical protein